MPHKISITTGEAPLDIEVAQPNEKPHTRHIPPRSGYDFEVVGPAVIALGADVTITDAPDAENASEGEGTGEDEVRPDADFEAENDANEAPRGRRR